MTYANLKVAAACALLACAASGARAEEPKADKFLDFTQPTFSADVDKAEDYVDPARANGRRCPDHPFRPGWVMVQTRWLKWRSDIARKYKASIAVNRVIEAGECTCDLAFPDWEEMRPDIEALWERFGNLPKTEWSDNTSDDFNKTRREISRSYSSKLGRYGAMCASLD